MKKLLSLCLILTLLCGSLCLTAYADASGDTRPAEGEGVDPKLDPDYGKVMDKNDFVEAILHEYADRDLKAHMVYISFFAFVGESTYVIRYSVEGMEYSPSEKINVGDYTLWQCYGRVPMIYCTWEHKFRTVSDAYAAKVIDDGTLKRIAALPWIDMTPRTAEEDNLFEDRYLQFLQEHNPYDFDPDMQVTCANYRELYYHYDDEGAVDWALVYLQDLFSTDEPENMLAADRIVFAGGMSCNFPFEYGVYDVARGEFITVLSLTDNLQAYPGLYEAIWAMNIGRPVADADGDRQVSILDATRIQRVLAELDEIEKPKGYDAFVDNNKNRVEVMIGDVDRDGKVSILDATCIQRYLAKLCRLDGSPLSA